MGSVRLGPRKLVDTLSETVGYKAGLALSTEEMCDHLSKTDYPSIIKASEDTTIRLRSEEYEEIFFELLCAVGYTDKQSDPFNARLQFYKKYGELGAKVISIFSELAPRLINDAALTADKILDPRLLISRSYEECGKAGMDAMAEWLLLLDHSLKVSPYTGVRYVEWTNIEKLSALFDKTTVIPEMGVFIDQRYINYLHQNPDKLSTMYWRKFEELTAEYFERQGFEVELGPGGNDNGVDIRVWKPVEESSALPTCIIQCKRYKGKIDKVTIKGLFTDVEHEGAEYGVIVTTSELSPGARDTITVRGYPIEEVNQVELREWLKALRTAGSGIVRV